MINRHEIYVAELTCLLLNMLSVQETNPNCFGVQHYLFLSEIKFITVALSNKTQI